MLKTRFQSLFTLFVICVAFLDGILVAGQFDLIHKEIDPAEALRLEDIFEQKNSSIQTVESPSIASAPPFISQAPYGLWDDPWATAAEEACIYMAMKWATSEGTDSPSDDRAAIAAELLAMAAWENQELGKHQDTNLQETLRILQEFYGLQAELSYEVAAANLNKALSAGNILLIPVSGEVLANRHYGNPAPQHHMILVYAEEGETVLAHDPGTLHGEATPYSIEKILEANQDLNGEKGWLLISR